MAGRQICDLTSEKKKSHLRNLILEIHEMVYLQNGKYCQCKLALQMQVLAFGYQGINPVSKLCVAFF